VRRQQNDEAYILCKGILEYKGCTNAGDGLCKAYPRTHYNAQQIGQGGLNMSGENNPVVEFDLEAMIGQAGISIMIPIGQIHPDPSQPRKEISEESLRDMADSIRNNGMLSSILVRRKGSDYIIIAGERRFRASKLAGLDQVSCIAMSVSEEEAFVLSLVENLHREDLTPMEEAAGYKKLMNNYRWTQERLARQFKKSKSVISEIMTINKLPEPVLKKVRTSELPKNTIIEIAKAPTVEAMEELVNKAVDQDLSVKEVREKVKALKAEANSPEKGKRRPVDNSPYSVFRKETLKYTKQIQKIAMVNHQKYATDDKTGTISALRIMIEHANCLLEQISQKNEE